MAAPTRVAVVNHDSVFLRLTDQILKTDGMKAILCPSGTSAHQVIVDEKPDIVMIDTWLNTRDEGWALLQTLRLDPQTKDLPILLCSSAPDEVKARSDHLVAMRNVLILPKPFDPEALLRAIHRLADPAARWNVHAQASIDDVAAGS